MNSLSKLDIANFALHLLGGGLALISLDEEKKEAKAISRLYPGTRQSLLMEADWTFAKKRVLLDDSAETNNTSYVYNYALPSDCLKALVIKDYEAYPFMIEDEIFYCDVSEAMLLYIYDAQDVSAFSPGFARALAFKLAVDLATYLEVSDAGLYQKYIMELRAAIGQDLRSGYNSKRSARSYNLIRFDYRGR